MFLYGWMPTCLELFSIRTEWYVEQEPSGLVGYMKGSLGSKGAPKQAPFLCPRNGHEIRTKVSHAVFISCLVLFVHTISHNKLLAVEESRSNIICQQQQHESFS